MRKNQRISEHERFLKFAGERGMLGLRGKIKGILQSAEKSNERFAMQRAWLELMRQGITPDIVLKKLGPSPFGSTRVYDTFGFFYEWRNRLAQKELERRVIKDDTSARENLGLTALTKRFEELGLSKSESTKVARKVESWEKKFIFLEQLIDLENEARETDFWKGMKGRRTKLLQLNVRRKVWKIKTRQ